MTLFNGRRTFLVIFSSNKGVKFLAMGACSSAEGARRKLSFTAAYMKILICNSDSGKVGAQSIFMEGLISISNSDVILIEKTKILLGLQNC